MAQYWKKLIRLLGYNKSPYWFAAGVTAALMLVAAWFFDVWYIRHVGKVGLTSTITASTEAMSFTLQEGRTASWNLPSGMFLVAPKRHRSDQEETEPGRDELCEPRSESVAGVSVLIGFSCPTASTSRLEIDGAALVTVKVSPAGALQISVKLENSNDASIRVVTTDGLPDLIIGDELGFEAQLADSFKDPISDYQVRLPLIVTSAQLGTSLRYVSTTSRDPEDTWQPALLAGSVSIIAQNHPDTEKYDVHSESLDIGDILGIGIDAAEPEKDNGNDEKDEPDLAWGMATIGHQATILSGTTEISQYLIHVVLHTTLREFSVTRFGTDDGHTIRATQWTILSRWPNGQKAWVAFVTGLFLLTTVLTLGGAIKDNRLKKKKKEK